MSVVCEDIPGAPLPELTTDHMGRGGLCMICAFSALSWACFWRCRWFLRWVRFRPDDEGVPSSSPLSPSPSLSFSFSSPSAGGDSNDSLTGAGVCPTPTNRGLESPTECLRDPALAGDASSGTTSVER